MAKSQDVLAAIIFLLSVTCAAGFQHVHVGSSIARETFGRTHLSAQSSQHDDEQLQTSLPTRRQFYQSISKSMLATSVVSSLSPLAAKAESASLETYTDADYGFRVSHPVDWKQSI